MFTEPEPLKPAQQRGRSDGEDSQEEEEVFSSDEESRGRMSHKRNRSDSSEEESGGRRGWGPRSKRRYRRDSSSDGSHSRAESEEFDRSAVYGSEARQPPSPLRRLPPGNN